MASNYISDTWSCDQCTYTNSSEFTKCNMCETPRYVQSTNQYQQNPDNRNYDDDLSTIAIELSSALAPPSSSRDPTSTFYDCSEYPPSTFETDAILEDLPKQQDKTSSKWECESCTYENDSSQDHCSMCSEGIRPYMLSQTVSDNPSQQSLQSNDLQKDEFSSKWLCSKCTFENESNDDRCSICTEGLRPSALSQMVSNKPFQQPARSDSPKPEFNLDPMQLSEKSSTQPTGTTTSSTQQNFMVFIPDLPFYKSNSELEQMIRLRLSNDYRVHVINVICYPNIGVGIVHIESEENKNYLVKNLKSVVLDTNTNTTVKFVEELQLISYVVFDENKKITITSDDIVHQWKQICNSSQLFPCEVVDVQFPNIFKIVSRSLDELLTIQNINVFRVTNEIARIYLNADCSFFEDLPQNITASQLTVAINAQIGGQFDRSSLYVQHNKLATSAIVLAVNKARQWANINYISLNGHNCMKKKRLTFRLVIYSIPHEVPIDAVINHKQLKDAVINSRCIGDKLIIDVKDKSVYDACITAGVLSINDHFAPIEPFTTMINDPENIEINAETWYETQMLDYQPDLKYFMDNPQHPIFKYKWNAQSWFEQFQRYHGVHNDENDKRRRLLRVTVMINTIGVLLKKGYSLEINNNKKEVKFNPQRMKSIIYDHNSKLENKKEITTSIRTPCPSTTVDVINEDCLVVYQKLVSERYNPVLLNMANAQTPGGGYRKGAGAQEENVFRRSNYYLSLDMEFDYQKQADRFWCTSTGEEKPVINQQDIYPIKEYGAIYTSGITVFRYSEDKGYAFLEQPLYNVCAVASAAYNRPELKRQNSNNVLADKFAVDTRKKIENIFSIAYRHGHDSLVLSAYGCGAFKNPPTHIAMIFKSVIEQYAGYFKRISFSVIDDHNTGNRINPDGNYLPFKKVLDNITVQPSKHDLDVNMISGPYRVINKNQGKFTIDHVKILDSPPCRYGSLCHELDNTSHGQSYSHPPLCPQYNSCTQSANDNVHLSSFIHRSECKYGGMCKLFEDDKHVKLYNHPEYCENRGFCANIDKNHLIKYRHVTLCRDGLKCLHYLERNADHCPFYRHCQSNCSFGSYCVNFHDKNHLDNQAHPFRQPCPLTPYACKYHMEYVQNPSKAKQEVRQHCLLYSHICPFGRQCNIKNDDLHNQTTIHIARNLCSDLDKCSKLANEEHLNSFTHPKIYDIRFVCKDSNLACHERRDPDHIKHYRHTGSHNYLGVVRYSGRHKHINFLRNQNNLIKNIRIYTDTHKWKPIKDTMDEITEWIRSLQPVHRCDSTIFESILVHGHVMSRKYMDMLRSAQFVANAVEQHQDVRNIFNRHNNTVLHGYARDFIRALVAIEFDKDVTQSGFPIASGGVPPSSHKHSEQHQIVKKNESLMKDHLKPEEIDCMRTHAIRIAQASLKLHNNKMGIGHQPDQSFGTDNHVFSIFGPNLGHYYGDIFIVFKHELMFHPDSNFSMQAATTYGQSGNAYSNRPWLKDPGTPKDRIQQFHWTKLHCSIPGYDEAAAMELMAITGLHKKSMDIKLKDIQERWLHSDPHEVFEGHLPQLIPLNYIDHIYMPKNVFDSLSSSTKQAANHIFRHNLTKTEHTVDLSMIRQLDSTRKPYQKHVIGEIMKKIDRNNYNFHRGTILTLPATFFQHYACIPMTISQSLYQYQTINKTKDQNDNVFIYWQALGGGIMLTLSQYQIDSSRDQNNNPSLMCHISDILLNNNPNDYRESYSYMVKGHPFKHDMIIQNPDLKAKSNTFHCGCNIYDYIGYCLRINRKKGEASLTHVGANSIYNHQAITRTFQRQDLDLSKLEYVHISAYNRTISIRNLVIRHEPIQDYHPSFDKDFKEGSGPLIPSPKRSSTASSHKASKDDQGQSEQSLFGYIKDKIFDKDDKNVQALKPCRDSVNCLLQNSPDESKSHNKKYSHPCPYSELCRSKSDHPHLTHHPHSVSMCRYDKDCRNVVDPEHRGKYRHSNLPDFLHPCRYQSKCTDKSKEHQIRYSHGEKGIVSSATATSSKSNYDGGHKNNSTSSKPPK